MLLEPLMKVYIETPSDFVTQVMGIMSKRNGNLVQSNFGQSKDFESINIAAMTFEAPLNFMFNFSSELRKNTQGKGEFTMEFCRYVPASVKTQNEAIENFKIKQKLQTK
ncbi:MAG: hypothetical protein MHPSP_001665 [Paramarteilia canceri]